MKKPVVKELRINLIPEPNANQLTIRICQTAMINIKNIFSHQIGKK